jgi:predicted metal-binding membrane protein
MTLSSRGFLTVSALLFVSCAVTTATWCSSMSGMDGMSMPGGWTMSMTWMLMPGQTWSAAVASFVGIWVVMMAAMMLPSLTPTLWRYREALLRAGLASVDQPTVLAGVGYFLVWTLLGIAAFPLGVALAAVEMRYPGLSREVPLAASAVIILAGASQFTSWKARQLTCCREVATCPCSVPHDPWLAFKHGVRLGVRCSSCCSGLTAVLLVVDVMDLRAMALLTAAIALERLLPPSLRVAQAIGVALIAAGLIMPFKY